MARSKTSACRTVRSRERGRPGPRTARSRSAVSRNGHRRVFKSFVGRVLLDPPYLRRARLETEQPLRVLPVNLVFLIRRQVEAFDDANGFPDVETGRRLKRHIGREQHVIHAKKLEAATRAREGAE